MKLLSLFVMSVLAAALSADTINYDLKKDVSARKNFSFSGDVMTCKGAGVLVFKPIKLDPNAKYTISAEFKNAGNAKSYRFFGGFYCYDKDGHHIQHDNIAVVLNTDTVLAEAANVGDKTITIKNGTGWLKNNSVAFHTKPDYSDLPNYDLARYITKVEKKESNWVVTLSAPLKKSYPAGTTLRVHRSGGYIYAFHSMPPADWKKYSGSTSGVYAPPKGSKDKNFWPGTVTFRPMIMVNWNWRDSNTAIEIRNVSLNIEKK